MSLTPELLADLRTKAEAARDRNAQPGEDAAHVVEVDPIDVLAMLDRIEALEAHMSRGGSMPAPLLSHVLGRIAAGASDHKTAAQIGAHLVAQGQRIEALEQFKRIAAKVALESSAETALQWLKEATART